MRYNIYIIIETPVPVGVGCAYPGSAGSFDLRRVCVDIYIYVRVLDTRARLSRARSRFRYFCDKKEEAARR